MAIAALSVHANIPPHPGAVAVASGLKADFGLMAAFGLAAMLPGAALGCWWAYRQVGVIDSRGGLLDVDEEDRVGGQHHHATAAPPAHGGSEDSGSGTPTTGATTALATQTGTSVPHLLPRLVAVLVLPVVLILGATIAQTFSDATGMGASVRDVIRFIGTPSSHW
jgi:GntP family gluconate:H+ symporter